MVAPVTNVRPAVILLQNFPVDAVARNAVRVVAVGRGGIDELGDETLDEPGVREGQGLPVLKDIPPVSLEMQFFGTVGVSDVDGKPVPGPAGVAVTPAEGQRQVFQCEPFHIGVAAGRSSDRFECVRPALMVQLTGKGFAHRCVPCAYEIEKVIGEEIVSVIKSSAAHNVEQGIGEVPGGDQPVRA